MEKTSIGVGRAALLFLKVVQKRWRYEKSLKILGFVAVP